MKKVIYLSVIFCIIIFGTMSYANSNNQIIKDFCKDHNLQSEYVYNNNADIEFIYVEGDEKSRLDEKSIIIKFTLPKSEVNIDKFDNIDETTHYIYSEMCENIGLNIDENFVGSCFVTDVIEKKTIDTTSLGITRVNRVISDVEGNVLIYNNSENSDIYDMYYFTEFVKKDDENFIFIRDDKININGIDYRLSQNVINFDNIKYIKVSSVDIVLLKADIKNINIKKYNIDGGECYKVDEFIKALWNNVIILNNDNIISAISMDSIDVEKKNDKRVSIPVGNNNILINNNSVTIDEPAYIQTYSNSVLVSLRIVSEVFGNDDCVKWDNT